MPSKIDENIKKRLRDNFDYDNNGRLSAFANKVASLNQPILIIGLGGTGMDIAIQVKRMIYDRMQCEIINGEWQEKPSNIEYLCLDTDIASKDKEANGLKFNESLRESFIFNNSRLATILRNKENFLSQDARSWVNDDLVSEMVINGAGAIRQVGRLMMFMNIDDIVEALRAKIKKITVGFDANTPIKVFILSGISGGTGSGTFIDVPYMVKGIANELQKTPEIVGILLLPDVNASRSGLQQTQIQSLKRNGFAALKELDYLMNLKETGEYFEQSYGNLHVKENSAPFYACILMSSRDKSGRAAARPYQYTINAAAETVVNFIAKEEGADPNNFSINSFLSNQMNDRAIFVNRLGQNRKPVNYVYCVAGASSAYLPLDDLISYMTYLAFQQIDQVWNNSPKETDVLNVIDRFSLGEESMTMRVSGNLPARPPMDRHRYELIEQNSSLVINDYEETLRVQKDYVDKRIEELIQSLKERLEAEDNAINEIFRDINKGPAMAQRVIYNTLENSACVVDLLKKFRDNFLVQKPTDQYLTAYRKTMNIALDKILAKKLLKNKGKLREEFLKSANQYYDETIRQYIFDSIARAYDRFNDLFMGRNRELYDYLSDLMNTLVLIFQKYGRISTQTSVHKHATGETLTWYMVDTPVFIKELTKRMGLNGELYVDLSAFMRNFYSKLFENADIWSGNEKADVVEILNRFIWDEFQKVLDKSMDYYLEFFANVYNKRVEDYCKDLLKTLDEKATIMFSFNAAADGLGVVFSGRSSISVPVNAQKIRQYAAQYNQVDVYGSEFADKIFMMNYKTAVPLYFYDELASCEDAYETHYNIPGVHLYEKNSVSGKDWHSLPSPYPDTEWMEGHKVPRVLEENNHYRRIFDKAKEYGFITSSGNRYFCRWGRPVDCAAILKRFDVSLEKDFNNPVNVREAYTAIKDELADQGRLTVRRPIIDCNTKEDGITPNEDFAKNIFLKMMEAKTETEKMVENHEACKDMMDKLEAAFDLESNVRNYLRCRFTGVIFDSRGGIYKYQDKDNVTFKLHIIEGTEINYAEYHLLNAFLRLDRRERDKLDKLSTANYADISESEEKYADMKKKVKEYLDAVSETFGRLKEDWQEIASGKMILNIYKFILDEAEAYYKKL